MLQHSGIPLKLKLCSLGPRPFDADARRSHDSRQRSLIGSLLTDTALEWLNDFVTDTTTRARFKNLFLNRFTDGRDQFKHKKDAENAARQDGKLMKNYFHRIESSIDRWPENIDVILNKIYRTDKVVKNID